MRYHLCYAKCFQFNSFGKSALKMVEIANINFYICHSTHILLTRAAKALQKWVFEAAIFVPVIQLSVLICNCCSNKNINLLKIFSRLFIQIVCNHQRKLWLLLFDLESTHTQTLLKEHKCTPPFLRNLLQKNYIHTPERLSVKSENGSNMAAMLTASLKILFRSFAAEPHTSGQWAELCCNFRSVWLTRALDSDSSSNLTFKLYL